MVIRSVVLYRREHDAVGNAALQAAALALWQRHGPRARATSGLVSYAIGLGFLRRPHEQLPLLDAARAQAAQHGQLGLLAFAHSVTAYVLADLRRYPESAASYRLCLQLTGLCAQRLAPVVLRALEPAAHAGVPAPSGSGGAAAGVCPNLSTRSASANWGQKTCPKCATRAVWWPCSCGQRVAREAMRCGSKAPP